jgi:heptaprenylglyceryl phosphate synthase
VKREIQFEVTLAAAARPGDTLILIAGSRVSEAQYENMVAEIKERLPGLDVILLDGIGQVVVYRPDAEPS